MAKEILIYQPLYSYTVADFINQMEANKGNDICGRVNCPGGDVYATYGALAKWNEHSMGKMLKIDGRADSMAAYMMCNADDVECLDVSKFIFHRAALPSYIENDKARFTDALKAELTTVNTDLRGLIEGKVTARKWKAVTGVGLDDLFSLESRIDVEINAEQAHKLGLVQRIVPLSKGRQLEINAFCSDLGIAAAYNVSQNPIENTDTVMEIKTLADFKATHPSLYAEAFKEGATQERDRVTAALVFGAVDLEAVKKVIAEGNPLSQTFLIEMGQKQMSAAMLASLEKNNTTIETEAPPTGKDANADEAAALKAQSDARIERFKKSQGIK